MRWFKWMSTTLHNRKLNPKRHPRLWWGASLAAGAILYLKVWLPLTSIAIPCVFHELTGFYCPGCGLTRAAISLLHLDFVQAIRYNSLVFALLPLYLLYVLAKKKKMRIVSDPIMAAMLIMTIAFGLLRNIPAFDFLAPTEIR